MTEVIISLAVGIALSACSGFRVFIPMLVANLATRFHIFDLSTGFEWLGSATATYILGAATIAEIMAFYIPVVDNLLDTITTPASFIAGTILTTSFLKIDSPELQWTLGILAGGGLAGTIQAGTGLLRLTSTKFTGGFGNPFLATLENIISIFFSILTLWLPILVAILGILLFIWLLKNILKRFKKKKQN
ncbi:hypothetical protein Emtol_0821 [Emticicia oligotrophica DSM 17448]|uniref:DUF4126 domain-containing protein n=1 Tax=Emticicia oligotrophica (strain DSM 17448 / CIP 109782 / MTCC 6937 / GPTSA100-15) TaxID=929562 RepID=A0ABM5MXR4_EMTOG|nr:DUF4126 domain-containing protein [Emticicia oligotrophica]AFK01972.1 hypothetical protein Emtol_0821 [Emticicia oligotrophica DSM 17448]